MRALLCMEASIAMFNVLQLAPFVGLFLQLLERRGQAVRVRLLAKIHNLAKNLKECFFSS